MKTVWVKAHGGSNPSACAIKKRQILFCLFFMEQSEVSTVLRIIGGSREEREIEHPVSSAYLSSDNTLALAKIPPPAPKKEGETPSFSFCFMRF